MANMSQNWHQGSGIVVNAPDDSECIQILGNHMENAAPGHGHPCRPRHRCAQHRQQRPHRDESHARLAQRPDHGQPIHPERPLEHRPHARHGLPRGATGERGPAGAGHNSDGGSIIANNIISDFGYGDSHWVWGDDGVPLRFGRGPEPDSPPLSDVIIQGNIIHDTGRDQAIQNGNSKAGPSYKYAVLVEGGRASVPAECLLARF